MATADFIRQQIATFSLVSQGFGGSNDPVAALFPFLSPIASDLDGQPLDPSNFRSEMKQRYGIVLSRDVTEFFVERLFKLKLLRTTSKNRDGVWVKQEAETYEETAGIKTYLDEILKEAKKLHAERQDLLKETFTDDSFLEALMGVLLNQHRGMKSAVTAVVNLDEPTAPPTDAGPRALDPEGYFASEFIIWTSKNRKDLFKRLAELTGTAFVAEALIEIRTPQPNTLVANDVVIYLDGPFLMELLGCSGAAEHDDAKLIVDTLQAQGISISVLLHSLEELQGNLKGVLRSANTERTGPTAKALLYGDTTEPYLEKVLTDPEHFLRQLKISLVDPEKLKHLADAEYFTDTDKQNFYARIYGLHYNQLARDRDVESITWVMRRRKSDSSRDILRSKHILLTRNPLLARYALKFAVENCDLGEVVPENRTVV